MKIKVIKEAYYDGELIKVGRIINYKGDKIPSWGTLADGIETKKGNATKTQNEPATAQENLNPNTIQTGNTNADGNSNNVNDNVSRDDKKTDEQTYHEAPQSETTKTMTDIEKQQYLELLINEGIEKNILIEDADKKTVDEQIKELEIALGKEEK